MPSHRDELIAVTGATGFVGGRLLQALYATGYRLRVLARDDKAEELFRSVRAEVVTGNIKDKMAAERLLDGVSGVFHLASIVQQAGIPDSEFWGVHVHATRRLLTVAAEKGVRKFVHCSTIGVLGHIEHPPADEDTPYNTSDIYQITKAEGEKSALKSNGENGMSVTVVRPAAVYGPGDKRMLKLFKMIATGKFRMIGDGETLIHPVYVDDLVDGMTLAYESDNSGGRVYILGGDKYVTLNDWTKIIAGAAGTRLSKIHVPYPPVRLAAIICEMICKPLGVEPPLFRRRVDFFVKNRAFTIERARNELGYNPKTDLEKGAARTLAWYREKSWI